jgi:hypothetical protein
MTKIGSRTVCRGKQRGRCLRRSTDFAIAVSKLRSRRGKNRPRGRSLAASLAALRKAAGDLRCLVARGLPCDSRPPLPRYDAETREFFLGKKLIHHFAEQASNVVKVLLAFQRTGWAREIPDPLGNHDEPGFEKRLMDTASALNRLRGVSHIHFSVRGRDRKIRWDLTDLRLCGRGSEKCKPGASIDNYS